MKYLNEYISFLRFRNYTEETIQNYQYKLNQLFEAIGTDDPTIITRADLFKFIEAKKLKLTPNTTYNYFIAIKNYLNYFQQAGFKVMNIAMLIPPKKVKGRFAYFTARQINRLLANTERETVRGARDYAIFLVLFTSGLRASELCSLKRADLGLSMQIIGKGKKLATVYISEEALKACEDYLKRRYDDNPYLFVSINGKNFSRQQLYKVVRRRFQLAGFTENTYPHALRHSFATHLVATNTHIRAVQDLMRHSNLDTTMRYTHISDSKLEYAHKKSFKFLL